MKRKHLLSCSLSPTYSFLNVTNHPEHLLLSLESFFFLPSSHLAQLTFGDTFCAWSRVKLKISFQGFNPILYDNSLVVDLFHLSVSHSKVKTML